MISLLKSIYRFFIKRPIVKITSIFNKTGNKHKCYVCENTFNSFTKYGRGTKYLSEYMKKLNMVGSDIDNFGCPYCSAHDRERHLYMFFDRIKLWEKISHSNILHFAPEKNLAEKIKSLNPKQHIRADFYPKQKNIEKIDATDIPYDNNTFDLLLCNHVLEHIPNYFKAIQEIFRVLKPNGIAILQTPYSKLLSRNLEEENINTDEQRHFFYGENDHYRVFSEKQFFEDLKKVGFNLKIIKNSDFFDEKTSIYYGINAKEDLVQVIKPSS
ncbi:class I SAM-dependent methyltransferase [Eudoraea adriatica]|uniref:class I SAM-dependent methyltransferase n=1 Tax=Eudoraea adriatica TaxID=446681 RepID=UPI00036B95DF|nr:class I SAM-dependent methyltransferase [Eudoraea adriatica]